MNTIETNFPKTGWQTLGELELSVGAGVNDILPAWLTEILYPLDLPMDFLQRVLNSLQDSTSRALQSSTNVTLGHIHLSVFVPNNLISKGKNWGFFNIERIENRGDEVVAQGHSIEFYLYME